MIKTANKKVLCVPFASTAVELEKKRGVVMVKQHSRLSKTTVVIEDSEGEYPVGTTLWLRGEAPKALASQQVAFDEEGMVLVPKDMVVAFETPPAEPTSIPGSGVPR